MDRTGSMLPCSRTSPSLSSSARLLVLGIETSCDDTGAAVVTSDGHVLGEALATQTEIHAPWGGSIGGRGCAQGGSFEWNACSPRFSPHCLDL